MAHLPCNDPACEICADEERRHALEIERGMRPGGRLLATIAKIKAAARRVRARRGEA